MPCSTGEYSGHELDKYSMFLERLARPPFRDMMCNQDIANRNLIPRTFNRPMILRKPLQLLTNILCDQFGTVRPFLLQAGDSCLLWGF